MHGNYKKISSANSLPAIPKTRLRTIYLIYLLFLAVFFIACAELIVRIQGISPWEIVDAPITARPNGNFFRADPALGYTHVPGHFSITLGTGYTFTTTNLPNTLRATHDIYDGADVMEKPEIWIFGCSYTYGWSLNDQETYPWILQKKFPDFEIVNFGVNGYGTIHSLIQLQSALRTRTPRIAILAYAGFHDERNTFLRSRQKAVAPWNRLGPLVQPYARMSQDGTLTYGFADVVYREFPLMRHLALMHFLEIKYNQHEDRIYKSRDVSRALVKQMADTAREHGVKFIVANIEDGLDMMKFSEAQSIPAVDISIDLNKPGYRNLPHDGHPSAIANKQYAENLEKFIKNHLLRNNQSAKNI